MTFPFSFKSIATPINAATTTSSAQPSWPWPICATNPRTLSFRTTTADSIYKTINPAYLDGDQNPTGFANATPEEVLIPSSPQESAVMSGLRSDRLFFDPGATSSILERAKADDEESVTMVEIDSRNPFVDFRASMEEMVEARGVRDWEFLEELLEWYLKVNDESIHGCIVGAFVDLLIHLLTHQDISSSSSSSFSSSAVTSCSFTSPLSFSSSIMNNENEVDAHKNG